MGVNVIQECQRCLSIVAEDVEDSILYLDAGAGEAFHFVGGLASLLELGARAVCSLEHASPPDAATSWRGTDQGKAEKIVVISSKLLSDAHRYILRCLRIHSSTVRSCTIWTSISEGAHAAHPDTPLGSDAFQEYKTLLLQDFESYFTSSNLPADIEEDNMYSSIDQSTQPDISHNNSHQEVKQCAARNIDPGVPFDNTGLQTWASPSIHVKHFPLMLCTLTRSFFVLPSGGAVVEAPLANHEDSNTLCKGLPAMDMGIHLDAEEQIPAGAILLADCLQHVAAQLDLKLEIFSMGSLSHVVGKAMTGLPSPPEGVGHVRRPAGLLLIDRSHDLITPSCHGDSLVDRMFSSLPRRKPLPSSQPSRIGPPHRVQSSAIVRPPLDLRIPVDSNVEGTSDTELKSGQTFPLFPVMSSRDLLKKGRSDQESSNVTAERSGVCLAELHLQEHGAWENTELLGGSLGASWNRRMPELLEAVLEKRSKDSLLLIRKWLQEALRQEKLNTPGKGRLGAVSITELRLLRKALSQKPDTAVRYMDLIQVARAAEESLGQGWGSRWDAFAGAEKVLMLSSEDNNQSLALQLQDIVQQYAHTVRRGISPANEVLSLRDALTLAIVGYALAGQGSQSSGQEGPFPWDEEQALKESIVEAILDSPLGLSLGFLRGLEAALATYWRGMEFKKRSSPDTSKVKRQTKFDDQWDRWEAIDKLDGSESSKEGQDAEDYGELQLKLEIRDRLGEVFSVLHKVASASGRSLSKHLVLPKENQGLSNPSVLHTGLISKIMSLTFAKVDIPGLEHHSSTVGRFFTSGLGRLGLRQAKPKLSDQKVLLVFVIGGINTVEVREALEAKASVPGAEGVELLFGGTTLLTPSDMYDLLLGTCGSL